MSDSKQSLQDEVNIFVKRNKILKKDFAAKIGITPVKFSHWLNGRTSLNIRTLTKIIAELDKKNI